VAAVTGWIYELLVWVRLLHLTGPYGIAENTAVLSFGPEIRSLGAGAFTLGVCIHCLTAVVWGILFALIWPALRARSIEATLAVLLSPAPPTYTVD
jgi:hypothetical protein